MNIMPIGKRVLAREIKNELVSESGLVLSAGKNDQTLKRYEVSVVGEKNLDSEIIKCGTIIFVDVGAGKKVDSEYTIIEEHEILGVVV